MANNQKSNGSAAPRLNCAEFFRNPYGLIDDEDSDNAAIGEVFYLSILFIQY